jgi:hypothetical protein
MIFLPLFSSLTVGIAANWYYKRKSFRSKEDKEEHLAESIAAVIVSLLLSWFISIQPWLIIPFGIVGGWYAKNGVEKLNRWL